MAKKKKRQRNYLERRWQVWFDTVVDEVIRWFRALVAALMWVFRGAARGAKGTVSAVREIPNSVGSDEPPEGSPMRWRPVWALGIGAVLILAVTVVRLMASGSDAASFDLRANTMILVDGPIAADIPPCPDGPSESPIDYSETSTLAERLQVFGGELIAVRLVLDPSGQDAPDALTFDARWPNTVSNDGPVCTFLISNGSETTLISEQTANGGTSFTVVDPSADRPTTVEVWLEAEDPVAGVRFTTNLSSESNDVIVDPLGRRLVVEVRENAADAAVEFPPVIRVWYGDTQPVGSRGRPQEWVNVVGNVSDHDGISSLTYSLNGDLDSSLEMGPDLRRLVRLGDFNIQLDYDELVTGPNTVAITATDQTGLNSTEIVTLLVEDLPAPTLPFETSFDPTSSILGQASVVDGPWFINEDATVTTDGFAYDRILAIGDMSWQDYEVFLQVTVHSLGTEYETTQSGNVASVGLGLRWVGHTQRDDENPFTDVYPTGALLSHEWFTDQGWTLAGNNGSPKAEFESTPEFDVTYNWRARVETVADGTEYRFKSWATDVGEPAEWDMTILEDEGPATGSVVLIAHHVDADFSNVTVTPLN